MFNLKYSGLQTCPTINFVDPNESGLFSLGDLGKTCFPYIHLFHGGINAMLIVVIKKVAANPTIIMNVPSLSVRIPPRSIPSGMATHAPAVITPKTRPRILVSILSNSIAPPKNPARITGRILKKPVTPVLVALPVVWSTNRESQSS